MRYLVIGILFWASVSVAQTSTANCTSYTLDGTTTSTHCTIDTPAAPTPPPPLPALEIKPPANTGPTTDQWMMMGMAKSNQPPSDRWIRKFCKKHPGEYWYKRNFNGVLVADGTCSK